MLCTAAALHLSPYPLFIYIFTVTQESVRQPANFFYTSLVMFTILSVNFTTQFYMLCVIHLNSNKPNFYSSIKVYVARKI